MSKVHEIDGKKYREVERKAKVDDLVTLLYKGERNDVISTVEEIDEDDTVLFERNPIKHAEGIETVGYAKDAYIVLEPLYVCDKCKTALGKIACSNLKGGSYCSAKCADADEPKTEEAPSPDLVDLIANLSAEVTQLKRSHAEQLDTLFRNVTKLGEELATLQTAEPVDSTPVALPKWILDRLMGGYRG